MKRGIWTFWLFIGGIIVLVLCCFNLYHWLAQVILMVASTLLCALILLASKTNHLVARLGLSLISFIGFIFLFALLYFSSYSQYGREAFRLSEDLEKSILLERYTALDSSRLVTARKLAYYPLLLNNAPEVQRGLNNLVKAEKRAIPSGRYFSDIEKFQVPNSNLAFVLERVGSWSKQTIDGNGLGGISVSYNYYLDNSGIRLFECKELVYELRNQEPEEYTASLERQILDAREVFQKIANLTEAEYVRATELDFSYFVYYSGATMTTVGSNDLNPNNLWTRTLAVIQALISLFIFGIALTAIWELGRSSTGS